MKATINKRVAALEEVAAPAQCDVPQVLYYHLPTGTLLTPPGETVTNATKQIWLCIHDKDEVTSIGR